MSVSPTLRLKSQASCKVAGPQGGWPSPELGTRGPREPTGETNINTAWEQLKGVLAAAKRKQSILGAAFMGSGRGHGWQPPRQPNPQ